MNFAMVLLIFLMGGVVIALAGKFILMSRKIEGDSILPEQLHFMYDFYREKLRKVLRE